MKQDPSTIAVPMPIRTPRLLIRPKQLADARETVAAVAETWNDLHQWMAWAQNAEDNTVQQQELRARVVDARFELRQEFNLVGTEVATGRLVIWCGFHEVDWQARRCETGFWVRKSAQGQGFATESTIALVLYAFKALGMKQVGITHSAGNEASRRIIEKLGFTPAGVLPNANPLPGGRVADRHCYVRTGTARLPALDVSWAGCS